MDVSGQFRDLAAALRQVATRTEIVALYAAALLTLAWIAAAGFRREKR